MVKYTPPPEDLSRLNPIQRYMQKGSLDFQDFVRLGVVVLVYWLLRPYIQRMAKRWSDDSIKQGEKEQGEYQQRRAQAAMSNDIRSGKKSPHSDGKTLGQLLDEGTDGNEAESSGATTAPAAEGPSGEIKNRKPKKKGVSFAPEKSATERTLDWEDESEFDPGRAPVVSEGEPQSGDIKAWMEKWTS